MAEDLIVANGYVLTCDPANRGGPLALFIRDGRIAEIADSLEDLAAANPSVPVFDATGKLIVPGFVNPHFHTESLLLRNLTDGVPLAQWSALPEYRETAARLDVIAPNELQQLYRAATVAHLTSGTTCVGEYGLDVAGERLHCKLAVLSRAPLRMAIALGTKELVEVMQTSHSANLTFLAVTGDEKSHASYTTQQMVQSARDLGVGLLLHSSEQHSDVEEVHTASKKRPMALLGGKGLLLPTTVLVHLNYLLETELPMVKNAGASVVVAPLSSAYKQTGYPALRSLLSAGVRVCIGSDWANTDMVDEMHFLARLHLVLPDFPAIQPVDILRMATINGAVALGLSADIGSIEPGKYADLVMFDVHDVRSRYVQHNAKPDTVAALVVHHLTSNHISHVMINGAFWLKDRQLWGMAVESILQGFQSLVEKYVPLQPKSIPFASATMTQEPPETGKERTLPVHKRGETIEGKPEPARPPRLVELPKNIRRVFGEDEEP